MTYMTESAKKVSEDLKREKVKIDRYCLINKIAACFLAVSSVIVYLVLLKDIYLLFSNPIVRLFIYLAIASLVIITFFNLNLKKPRSKFEMLRQALIKKIEWDFCKECSEGCVHKEDFLKEMYEKNGINLYY